MGTFSKPGFGYDRPLTQPIRPRPLTPEQQRREDTISSLMSIIKNANETAADRTAAVYALQQIGGI